MKIKAENGKILRLTDEAGIAAAAVLSPVILEIWDGKQESLPLRLTAAYGQMERIKDESGKDSGMKAVAVVEEPSAGSVQVTDEYTQDGGGIRLDRTVEVLEQGTAEGIRLFWEMELFPEGAEEGYKPPEFSGLKYFAPPALYDKNDLDEDGFEDYFHTQKLLYRDDRFNYPMFMAYQEESGLAVRMERDVLPAYDSFPVRGTDENGVKDSSFLQKTDIGSLGVKGKPGKGVKMCACYPFYEGDATIGLYIMKTVPFGAYWPLRKGETFHVSWKITADVYRDFHEACWDSVKRVIRDKKPVPAPLLAAPEKIVRYRLEALDRYYVEKNAEEDANCPAGYVLNCHPQDGEQLENIIQYGFTGQNMMNACNMLRYGYEKNVPEYRRKAVRVADFFTDVIAIKESGMFYNLYDIDRKKVNFWWTGLLLPLAYAEGEELRQLMGPLYEYRKEIIEVLSKKEGAYLRCMNEDATELLRLYRLEKEHGKEHENWRRALENYGLFLLKTQEEDGTWYRAYDLQGKPVIKPELWFGRTVYEKKSSTATSIPFLVELYQLTGENRYLEAARRAGIFVEEIIIDKVRFNGGVHDSIYAKGQLIDNEGILYPMFGMLSLYEELKEEIFLEGAVKAARLHASFVCLWKVPLPPESTLAKYGFNSIGMGACDTCGSGYLHPFQLMGVAQMAQIAIYAKDKELFEAARLYFMGCSQTVALPGKDWGYAYPGLQEEGYLVSWWAVDDPMFATDTGFGHRLKGEGNKTCFPWINAVGVKAYWNMLDRFQTLDFDSIHQTYFAGKEK